MKRFWGSKLGWTLALVYLAVALGLFSVALTCAGMLCELAAWPVFLPTGAYYYLAYEWLDQWYVFGDVAAPFREPWLVVPSVITNAGLYYLVGVAIGIGFEGPHPSRRGFASLRAFLLMLLIAIIVFPFVWALAAPLLSARAPTSEFDYSEQSKTWFVPLDFMLARKIDKTLEFGIGGAWKIGNSSNPSYRLHHRREADGQLLTQTRRPLEAA